MYDIFNTVQYPLAVFAHPQTTLPDKIIDALKKHFVDFRLQLYSTSINSHVFGYLTKILNNGNLVEFYFDFKAVTPESELNSFDTWVSLKLSFDSTAEYAAQEKLRVYFDDDDCSFVDPKILKLEGYACFDKLAEFTNTLSSVGSLPSVVDVMVEPSTISIIGKHRVDYFQCQYAKPLLLQTAENTYTELSEPVTGAVNFIGGANCLISLQSFSNSVIISALRGANGSVEEKCGVWAESVDAELDVLCNEAAYSIGGATPDGNGNIDILGEYPFTVTPLALPQLPLPFQAVASNFPHIIRFIFVGLPGGSSSITCNIDPDTLPNPCN